MAAGAKAEKAQPLLSEKVQVDNWAKFEGQDDPNIFENLTLANDSGFGEVKELYDHTRWISAGMLIIFVAYNVEYIAGLDIGFILDPNNVEGYTPAEIAKINDDFYLTKIIYSGVFSLIDGIGGFDKEWALQTIKPAQVLGLFEFIGISYYLITGIMACYKMAVKDGKDRWYSCATLFWDVMPTLSVYSAMKLLDKIVPSKLGAMVTLELAIVNDRKEKGLPALKVYEPLLGLVLTCAICFLVGFDVFLLRLRITNINANRDNIRLEDLAPCLLFLVQVLGVVQLGPFVRHRLFIFIFAGEDGILQESEREKMWAFNGMLARRIYRDYSFFKFLGLMMSFSDEDFQKLVLNENATKPPEETPREKLKKKEEVSCLDGCTLRDK